MATQKENTVERIVAGKSHFADGKEYKVGEKITVPLKTAIAFPHRLVDERIVKAHAEVAAATVAAATPEVPEVIEVPEVPHPATSTTARPAAPKAS